jgi:hypothetical protein
MVLNISHEDKKKYKERLKEQKTTSRKRRTAILSDKTMGKALKQSKLYTTSAMEDGSVQIDEHMKMNDNYMRTGPYQPKKK